MHCGDFRVPHYRTSLTSIEAIYVEQGQHPRELFVAVFDALAAYAVPRPAGVGAGRSTVCEDQSSRPMFCLPEQKSIFRRSALPWAPCDIGSRFSYKRQLVFKLLYFAFELDFTNTFFV